VVGVCVCLFVYSFCSFVALVVISRKRTSPLFIKFGTDVQHP